RPRHRWPHELQGGGATHARRVADVRRTARSWRAERARSGYPGDGRRALHGVREEPPARAWRRRSIRAVVRAAWQVRRRRLRVGIGTWMQTRQTPPARGTAGLQRTPAGLVPRVRPLHDVRPPAFWRLPRRKLIREG